MVPPPHEPVSPSRPAATAVADTSDAHVSLNLIQRAAKGIVSFAGSQVGGLLGEPIEVDGVTLARDLQICLMLGYGRSGPPERTDIGPSRRTITRAARFAAPAIAGVTSSEWLVDGGDGTRRLRVYRPEVEPETAPPGILFFHGGGWAVGDLDSADGSCRMLTAATGAVVMSLDYRLAPEHPFPAATNDAEAAYKWVHANAAELGIAPGRIALAGDSAGASLAAVLSNESRYFAEGPPIAQCLIYPPTDAAMDMESHARFATGFGLDRESMLAYRAMYLPRIEDRTLPRAVPLYEPDLTGVPVTLLATAGFDPLRDEGTTYGNRLADAGVEVHHTNFENQIHGFFSMAFLDSCRPAALEICDRFASLLERIETTAPAAATISPV